MLDYMIDNEAIEFGSRKKTILMIQTAAFRHVARYAGIH